MGPGLAYAGKTYELVAEANVPLNNTAGQGVGFRAQITFFLEDLMPAVFGQPLLTR